MWLWLWLWLCEWVMSVRVMAVWCCLQSDLHVHFVNGYPGMMAHLGPTIALAIVSCLTGLQTRRFVCLLEMPHRAVAKMRCSGWA